MLGLTALACSLSPLLTIWLHWEQAGSIGSSIAGSGETGFARSKLVAVNLTSLVGVKLALLGASW